MAKVVIEKYKSFEKCKSQEVDREFGLKRNFNFPDYLTSFLKVESNVNESERKTLEGLQNLLFRRLMLGMNLI